VASWPNPNDYVEALQNPRLVFADKSLQAGTVITDRLGLPRAISGNFAIVFEVESQDRKQRWAIRCFSREVPGQRERYAAISQHLSRHKLPYTVGFEYQPQGIRIKGQWYPIVKMEWVRGVRLDTYIEQNLGNTAALRALANRWEEVIHTLTDAKIAHGDLQHGNIVIADGDIKLIDYDGMIVPGLEGKPSGEIGHRHYQHPSRVSENGVTRDNFVAVDNFSTWVIWSSLILLWIDPSLWNKTKAGDDRLLFNEKDYKQPGTSNTLLTLKRHTDARVQTVNQWLTQMIQTPYYLQVNHLAGWEGVFGPPPDGAWLADHVKAQPARAAAPAARPAPAPQAPPRPSSTGNGSGKGTRPSPQAKAWLEDFVPRPPDTRPLDFPVDWVAEERRNLEVEYDSLPSWQRVINLGRGAFINRMVRERFEDYPIVQQKRRAEMIYREAQRQQTEAENALITLQDRLRAIYQQIDAELTVLVSDVQTRNDLIDESRVNEQRDLTYVRDWKFERYMETALASFPLRKAKIRGIGASRIESLEAVGIMTAADINPANEGLAIRALEDVANNTPGKALQEWTRLESWRRSREKSLNFQLSPDDPDITGIVREYETYRQQLEAEIAAIRARIAELDQLRKGPPGSEIDALKAGIVASQKTLDDANGRVSQAEQEVQRYMLITPRNLTDKILKG
jgi:hypothetical protein